MTNILQQDCFCKLFADDLKLYSVVNAGDDNVQIIQSCLDALIDWSRTWQLAISYKKCSVMTIGRSSSNACLHLGNDVIETVQNTKDLGVHIDTNLTFSTHINIIVARAHARANLIHKCFLSKDQRVLTKAFVTYVRPILEYVSVMWSPYHIKEISKVESVQRRFTKRIAGLRNMSYTDRLDALQLESLEM